MSSIEKDKPDTPKTTALTLTEIRAKLSQQTGKDYWRGLEELSDTTEFQEFLHREFPREASAWDNGYSRRSFLKLMGASLALAGISACTKQPDEKIIPYVKPPEEVIPGKPLYFATAIPFEGYGHGVLVKSNEGRPTKIEGNPAHPSRHGAMDIFTQASILSLYDPDRSQNVTHRGNISTWEKALAELRNELNVQRQIDGAGIRILTETITSPTLAAQLRDLLKKYPGAKWLQYDSVGKNNEREGSKLAFGQYADTHYELRNAKVIVSIDSDFLFCGPRGVKCERDFADGRRVAGGNNAMNRLYAIETCPTTTGASADHRMPLSPIQIEMFAFELARRLGVENAGNTAFHENEKVSRWISAVVRDLQAHRGSSVVLVGESQPPIVHALGHAMNAVLGNDGSTVFYSDPVEAQPADQLASLRELVGDMKTKKVNLLLIIGGNPVYNAPADLNFAGSLDQVSLRFRLGMYDDETSSLCHWHIPMAHPLEMWGDIRSVDGTSSIMQPLIAPIFGGKSPYEFVSEVLGSSGKSGYDIVQSYWKAGRSAAGFDAWWRETLNRGFIETTALPRRSLSVLPISFEQSLHKNSLGHDEIEIAFRPDPTVWNGEFSNNGWLQELPKPMTKLTWDNAALVSPKFAEQRGLTNGDLVEIGFHNQSVPAPIWILPGHADNSVTLHLGYGRTRVGHIGNGAGFNSALLRTSDAMWNGSGATLRKTGQTYPLSSTQVHHAMEGREPVRVGTLDEYLKNSHFATEDIHPPEPGETLYPPVHYDGYAWGMTIDLNACTGCNACVIACQAENNIPIVGKEQVAKSREMHWIRVDRYFRGDLDDPAIEFQPLACVHCENAPCELVCPVNATVHDSEGLNVMVYNRCVGTRYCSNNCPYKVRRFNFLEYHDQDTPVTEMQYNPDVTVRSRGVMEKCTYCIQRISHARIEAKKEDREIRDGEVVTACQSACPSQAITFGNLNDPSSRITQMRKEPRSYGLLAELNTRPRTTYLARLRNPNPELPSSEQG